MVAFALLSASYFRGSVPPSRRAARGDLSGTVEARIRELNRALKLGMAPWLAAAMLSKDELRHVCV